MSLQTFADELRNRYSSESSIEDQITAIAIHYWVGTHPDGPYLKTRELEELLDELGLNLNTSLYNTVIPNLSEKGIIDGFQPDGQPNWWVIRQRDNEFVMGDKFDPAIREERERIISHIQSMDPAPDGEPGVAADGGTSPKTNDEGETLREVVAEGLDVPEDKLEDHLRNEGYQAQRSKINDVVDIVQESNAFEKPDRYDKIVLRPSANKYHLTKRVIDKYGLN